MSLPLIYVVSGLPRSGTSLVMQMLKEEGLRIGTDGVRKADSDNPMGYFELEAVKRIAQDSSFLDESVGCVIKVVSPLLRFLPGNYRYRVVCTKRPFDEVFLSQRSMLSRGGRQALSDSERQREEANEIALEVAFKRSLSAAEQFMRERPEIFDVMDIQHAQILENPERAAGLILNFIRDGQDSGGQLANDVQVIERMASVVDSKLYRSRL